MSIFVSARLRENPRQTREITLDIIGEFVGVSEAHGNGISALNEKHGIDAVHVLELCVGGGTASSLACVRRNYLAPRIRKLSSPEEENIEAIGGGNAR